MSPLGSIAISFTHTRTTEDERLPNYGSVLAWAEAQDVLTAELASRLSGFAKTHPRQAAAAHIKAVRLRDDLYDLLKSTSMGEDVDPKCLDTLNTVLRQAASHRILVGGSVGHEWSWDDSASEAPLDAPVWRVAQSAAELLTSPRVERLGVCAADTCQWLFIDESRNKSRRWCDMSDCGTRAKVRRFRARAKSGKGR